MKGTTGFIIGFTLSLTSVSLGCLLCLSPNTHTINDNSSYTQIDLFKNNTSPALKQNTSDLFASVHKTSLTPNIFQDTVHNHSNDYENIAPEDDEILNINIDGSIPIEYDNNHLYSEQAEVVQYDETELTAMLPTHITDTSDEFDESSPWVIAKGGKHIKNKQLLEDMQSQANSIDIAGKLSPDIDSTAEDSYKVAERIKSSLLFPIPSEILNDENLTPTFIKKKNKKDTETKTPPAKELKIISPAQPKAESATSSNGILNSISSWLSSENSSSTENNNAKKTNTPPSYSSQGTFKPASKSLPTNNNEFVNFYKTLQETSAAQHNNSIIPSELKLSFQPERAEISGQTLRWLKAFSEATQNENTYLQIRLDATASTELQRKRLNLLYTIFMNNGVDLKKIDTVFSLTEPNAFIIRTLKMK